MRVLVVEDDDAVAGGIVDGLRDANFDPQRAASGAEGLRLFAEEAPDVVVLDLGLGDMDGTDVCRQIRARSTVPIIIVSARDEEIDRVIALEIGADDYLVKPFGMRELVARMRAVLRRAVAIDSAAETPAVQSFGALAIDARAQRVTLDGTAIHFTAKEFALLLYLASDAGAVFQRTQILRDVWETDWYGTTKTLDAHVAAIRKKLGDARWIESVRGVGFRFDEPR
jgi:two-component system, OmpR family, response regulator RegX3